MIGKFVSKVIQSLPSWEVTKYYGRVCMYQLKCIKYKVQTSEAWFNFKCKFMPGSLRNEIECEETVQKKVKEEQLKQQKGQEQKLSSETGTQQNVTPKIQYDVKNSYISNEFIANTKTKKTQENEKYQEHDKHQENEKYSISEDYPKKKQRKAKRAQH